MPVHLTARFEVQHDRLVDCEAAIHEFVEYVRMNEPDTLLYTSLREKDAPHRFIHYFIFKDEVARDLHANSDAVNRFTGVLYPNLVAPVEFIEYHLFAATK